MFFRKKLDIQLCNIRLDKFNVKYRLAVELKSKYLVNRYPLMEKYHTLPEYVVIQLIKPFIGRGLQ